MKESSLSVASGARELFERVIDQLPAIVAAIALLLVGWVVARVLRVASVRGMQVLEALVERVTHRHSRLGARRTAAIFSTLVFWAVLLFFITAATHVLGLVTFTAWLARLLDYLPTLAAGLLIIAAGIVLSGFVGDLVHAAAERLDAPQRTALSRLAKGATLVAALLVGAEQIGLQVTWIAILALLVIGSVLGGVMLSVSLGARSYVANLIGAHYIKKSFRVGDNLKMGGFSGQLLEVTSTSVVLETPEGRVVLPGHLFHSEAIVQVMRNGDG